jgi:DNA anti-recombination protein RmuC
MNEVTKAEIRKRLGNISQLRELLFGDQIDEYDHRLEQYHQRLNSLETNLQQSQAAIKARLTQLEQKLLEQLNAVASSGEQRSKYYYLKTQSEQHQLQQELEHLSQSSQENIDLLHQTLNNNTNSLKTEIAQSKSDLDRDITLFNQQLSHKLETHLQELIINKISRTDLAEVLLELSLKLKETNPYTDRANTKD